MSSTKNCETIHAHASRTTDVHHATHSNQTSLTKRTATNQTLDNMFTTTLVAATID